MENYVVSARKYRPTGFEEVVGQSHITTTLDNAIKNNQLAQAYLFCGPRGVGKTTCARIVARLINQFNDSSDLIPGSASAHLNIYELDAASNNSVDDIRNLVEQVRYPPQYGKYKVYIIDEVHMLSNAAFNAFLKTLEEPPSYAIFILATTEKHKVIPTILSRCQIFDFKRIQNSDITNQLVKIAEKEEIGYDLEALNLIAQKSEGALRDALSLFDLIVTFSTNRSISFQNTIETLHILDYDYYFKMVDLILQEKANDCLLVYDEILTNGFDGHQFVMGLGEHFRNLLVCKNPATVKLLPVSEAIQQKYLMQAANTPTSAIVSGLSILNNCDIHYKASKNQRLHVELALVKLAYLPSVLTFSSRADQKNKPDAKAESARVAYRIQDQTESKTSIKKGISPGSNGNQKQLVASPKLNINQIKEQVLMEAEIPFDKVVANTSKPLNLEEIKALIAKLKETKKAEDKYTEFLIFNTCEAELKDEDLVTLKVDNAVQIEQFERIREEIQMIFRKLLSNGSVRVIAELKLRVEEPGKLIYSPKDKLEHIIKNYPAIAELKSRLGLDYD